MPDIPYSDKPLYVGIVWHQHQPFYKDLIDGTYLLPWVRLHAVKDYYDMAAILEEFPAIHLTFNLVPSLLIQLDDYAKGNAVDPFLRLTLKPAAELKKEDRIQILQDFFTANWKTMVEPFPRYNQLLNKRGRYSTKNELSRISTYFSTQDFLDLQVWFNLTWTDPFWRNNDSLVKNLFKKGAKFTEKDKIDLIAKHREICGNVIPKPRRLQEKGQIEISTTPL